ncbi:MAG: hypothetical protein HUN04_24430 [Desulfobacter sp.]|nr:MAG: hypothetical protein HUN04_24430 [Desulfobacter sp.]
MKITDPEVIKNGEKDLIASVQEDLDPGTVREILKERLAMAAMEPKGGKIVVHDNEIAFRLDFQVNLSGSLLFDRNGNLIEEPPAAEADGSEPEDAQAAEPGTEQAPVLDPAETQALEADVEEEDILEDLQAIAPDQALTGDEPVDLDAGATDDLSIDLPDYDLEDEEEENLENILDNGLDAEPEDDLNTDLAAELAAESLEDEEPTADTGGEGADSGDLDDDINDLLKESREFWAQKKNS